ncbi:MAG: glycosyltransferase family 2 protein [Armatimonadetes bacterium]|nr:glycosyltransferase family 2 protein [Armatimonadota bacterium]
MEMSVSVIIVTLNRPDCVRRCLECLVAQVPPPEQIIVVDASADDRTLRVVQDFPGVLYLRNDNGFGRMTASRNIGLKRATGSIIAFLDDDAFAHPGWLAGLRAAYTDDTVGAVGGRALNNQPDEARTGVGEIGRLQSNGELAGNFAAEPEGVIEVDHIMGCNMSFRRQVLSRLGGFREDYPGISGVREDSDMCIRVKRLGYRILFSPLACVDHISAPQATGSRFDTRYAYYLQRNHICLLIRNFGPGSGVVWRYLAFSVSNPLSEFFRRIAAAVVRLGTVGLATTAGIVAGLTLVLKTGRAPERHDAEGKKIRAALDGIAPDDTPRSEAWASNSAPLAAPDAGAPKPALRRIQP